MEIVDQPLHLTPDPVSVLPGPFTPAAAAGVGISRSALERLVRNGRVVRLLRGVYLDASVPCSPQVRSEAVALVVGGRQVVVGRTAAWLHGAPYEALVDRADGLLPIEVHAKANDNRSRRFRAGEVVEVGGVRCTSPVRTATDLGRGPGEETALAALDGLLRGGSLSHRELILAAEGCAGMPGAVQLREVAARADGRADGAAESVLRLRWHAARLPTPAPGFAVDGVRFALALPTHRYGAIIHGRIDEADRIRMHAAGWRVLVLDGTRVLSYEPRYLVAHLEREFHQHLLGEVG